MVLEKFGRSLNTAIRKLLRLPLIDEQAIKEFILDLQRALLTADVNFTLVDKLSENIRERTIKGAGKKPPGIRSRQ